MKSGRLRWTGILIGLVAGVGLAGQACHAAEQADEKVEKSGKAAPAVAPASKAPETWQATAFVSGIGSYRILHYWPKGPSMRAETLLAGHPTTTLAHGDRYVSSPPSMKAW